MFFGSKEIKEDPRGFIVGFDLEWTKNYKIKNANLPFCFSFVYFPAYLEKRLVENKINFGYYVCYVKTREEMPTLIEKADKILENFFQKNTKIFFVGHQLSSDISVVLNQKNKGIKNFQKLKLLWHNRNYGDCKKLSVKVFDTRYDLNNLKNKSRRLVDVCREYGLEVFQPELLKSMTKMQNNYYDTGELGIMEKLSVLNLRHSLSAAMLFLIYKNKIISPRIINVNRILYQNLSNLFGYVRSDDFLKLL